jgi:hypothetical protein
MPQRFDAEGNLLPPEPTPLQACQAQVTALTSALFQAQNSELRRLHLACAVALDALENHSAIKHPQQAHYRDRAIDALREVLNTKPAE